MTYDKTVHVIFPAELRYVALGSPDLIAGKADGAENIIRVKATAVSYTHLNQYVLIDNSEETLQKFEKSARNMQSLSRCV